MFTLEKKSKMNNMNFDLKKVEKQERVRGV
jgi:hypothetical protein